MTDISNEIDKIMKKPTLKRRMSLETPKKALKDDHRRRKQRKLERIERQRSNVLLSPGSYSPVSQPSSLTPAIYDYSPNAPLPNAPLSVNALKNKNNDNNDEDDSNAYTNIDNYISNNNNEIIKTSPDKQSSTSTQYSSVKAQRHSKHLQGKYEIVAYLGHGSYGHVYKARNLKTNEFVAIKRIIGVFENLTTTKRLLRELRMLRQLDHDNIIEFHEIIAPLDVNKFSDLWIVFEFVETDLHKLINHPQNFTNLHVQFFLYQILLGLHFMHTAQIIHRDLKPANLLVNSNCTLKICDFGLARGIHMDHASDFPFYRAKNNDNNNTTNSNSNKINNNNNNNDNNDSSSSSSSSNSSSDNINNNDNNNDKVILSADIMSKIHPDLIRSANNQLRSNNNNNNNNNRGRFPRPPLKRRLTQHVVTRWYRAPELILCTKTYTAAIDMWSVGCVFAELLTMLRPHVEDRRPVFPGTSCYPLSNDRPKSAKVHKDQLNVIFDVIGSPSENDIIEYPEKTKQFLRSLPKYDRKVDQKFSFIDKNALDLLENLLQFDPNKRYSCQECLKHPYLQDVSDVEMEKHITSVPIDFEFEDKDIEKEELRRLVLQEILFYNPHLIGHTNPPIPPIIDTSRISTPTSSHTTSSPGFLLDN